MGRNVKNFAPERVAPGQKGAAILPPALEGEKEEVLKKSCPKAIPAVFGIARLGFSR